MTVATGGTAATEPAKTDDAKKTDDTAAAAAATAKAAETKAAEDAAKAATAAAAAGKKTDDGKTDDKGTPPAGEKKTPPEKYSLTLPEGGHLDETDLRAIESVARLEGWTNEEAQAKAVAHHEALVAQSKAFLEETTADPIYGGTKLEQTQTHAMKALDRLRPKGTPRGDAIRALLNKTGYGNHIEVVSLLADIGKMSAEDNPPPGNSSSGETSTAEMLYGKG